MKVVSYVAGVPSPHKNQKKIKILTDFSTGVNRANGDDVGIIHKGYDLIDSDIGVIQGWVHKDSPNMRHLNLRRNVATNTKNKKTIIIDSNLFNYEVGKDHFLHYSRYSLNGVFPTTGSYFTEIVNKNRWLGIFKDLNLKLKKERKKGNHILICCQRNGGWSMKGLSVENWILNTVKTLKKYTDRPIICRAHPGDKKASTYLRPNPNYNISRNSTLVQDFQNAWAVVTFNSSPGTAAAIEGLPVFVTDPVPKTSQAYEVANVDLKNIEQPKFFDRIPWIESLAMCHWKNEEILQGKAWTHFRQCIAETK